ncbi:MAG TPA: SDR family NAD(P)-dependent oxidoreductase [Ilumatobacteraceae bacterium]|jgi:NAD(P)-dependent dehydrogenase (short-subunit alcohol dehydrogenase family)|nr:SDR family NAD(P)-dependent oxidoreductase [Ilumatobacteraceae bacterium]
MNITDKAVLITGANRGIGQALVTEALRLGAKRVYAASRQPLTNSDARVTSLTFDLTDAAQIDAAASEVDALDVLINNAGISLVDDLEDREALDQHLAVNLFGTYAVTQAFLPVLTSSRGAVVNVVSLAAFAPVPVMPAYSISKAAMFSLTQSQRALFAGRGIDVHAVLAGPVDTDMSRDLDIPKASPDSVAAAIFEGVENGEEEIFPDPMSQPMAEGWRNGQAKAFERGTAAMLPAQRRSFTTSFTVEQSPQEVFAAINNVREWWTGDIEGNTSKLGDEFTYRYEDIHRSTQKIIESIPDERIVWHVEDAYLSFADDKTEWIGTDITFEIAPQHDRTEVRFTHVGLVPQFECFDNCSNAWGFYINGSLRSLITTGRASARS